VFFTDTVDMGCKDESDVEPIVEDEHFVGYILTDQRYFMIY
jgi:hypothetical protein